MYSRPTAVNASTTYGVDGSSINAYGLGSGFQTKATHRTATKAKAASPSLLWLAAIAILGAIFL